MLRTDTDLPGVCILEPRVLGDERGFFYESYHQHTFADLGIRCEWVQDNHSRSARGVLRGLHYQLPPHTQDKLVRVVVGAAYDVVVDIRQGSPTFGCWTGVELSAINKRILFVPKGFAHGFLALAEGTEFLYKCSDFYAPPAERGIAWNDPDLGIAWPLAGQTPIINARDRAWPRLAAAAPADLLRT